MVGRRMVLLVSLGPACGTPAPSASTTDEPGTTGATTQPGSTTGRDVTDGPGTSSTGSPGTSTSTGAPTDGTGTTEAGSEGPPPPIFDLGVPDAPKMPPRTPPWLVHIANVGGERHLFQIDIDTAVPTDVCTLTDAATGLPFSQGTPSVTFTRDDRLLFSTGSAIYELALPSCEATLLGDIGYGGVYGICPDEANDLYGLSSSSDALIHIDAATGMGTMVGPLGDAWSMLGGTWNEVDQQILGINSVTDGLYDIDSMTGMASLLQVLPLDFMNVGMEFHPLTEQIYACTSDSHLYRLEMDGSLTDLGDMGFDSCTNLGAPWSETVQLPTPS